MFDLNLNYLLALFAVAVIGAGQVAFKYAAQHIRLVPSQTWLEVFRDNSGVVGLITLVLVLYLISTAAWVQALRTMPLSIAYMLNSLAFILVPAAGFALFGEPVPRYFLPGLMLIIAGIILVIQR